MKLKEKKPRALANFIIWDDNKARLQKAKSLGLSKGRVINEMLRQYYDDYLVSQANRLNQSILPLEDPSDKSEMVRGGGFEPPTPTVSR